MARQVEKDRQLLEFVLASKHNYHNVGERHAVLEDCAGLTVVISHQSTPDDTVGELKFRTIEGKLEDAQDLPVIRENQCPILGTLGVIKLLSGWFVILITEQSTIGKINGSEVFLVTKTALRRIPRHVELSEEEKVLQRSIITSLAGMLDASGFYYSKTYDLTHSVQRQVAFTEEQKAQHAWMRADERFFWNKHISQPFVDAGLHALVTPVVDGFICIESSTLSTNHFTYALISRRECLRTGTRFNTRGADPAGNVANFVESEQIVEYNGNLASWVETRGSIPVLWEQPVKGLKPKPVVTVSPFTRTAYRRHIEKQLRLYGDQILLNLIDMKGNEQAVGEAYETVVRLFANPNVKYVAFDFHEECKNNNYASLARLVESLQSDMRALGFSLVDRNGQILLCQKGNVRTNCIDCLDRTNVVQSQLARFMLFQQLTTLGIIPADDDLNNHPQFIEMLNFTWTDNADTMSKRYTGVGALKTDFTRTGKRSARGAMADGVKSAQRLYQSAFNDETKQSSIELFLGHLTVDLRRKFMSIPDEGVQRFRACKKSNWEDKGKHIVIELCRDKGTYVQFSSEDCSVRTSRIQDVVQVVRSTVLYTAVNLLFSTSAQSKKLIFPSVEEREKFLVVLESIRNQQVIPVPAAPSAVASGSLIDHPPASPAAVPTPSGAAAVPEKPAKAAGENLTCFIGSCNMGVSLFEEPPSLENVMPPDRDMYVLGVQNCAYSTPKGFYFSSLAHWSFCIQKYLGLDYEVVAVSSLSTLTLLVMVHKKHVFKVSNIDFTYAIMMQPKPVAGVESSPGKGFGGFFKALTSEVKKGLSSPDVTGKRASTRTPAPNVETPDTVGIAVSMMVSDTSTCFINLRHSANPWRLQDFDIANQFDHVFCFGDVNMDTVDSRWVQLVFNPQFGSAYWRNLLDVSISNVMAAPDMSPASPLPLRLSFVLSTTFPQEPYSEKRVIIQLFDLQATNLTLGDTTARSMRALNPYLIVHSPFLRESVRTAVKRKTWNPAWSEVLMLKPIGSPSYLYKKHIMLEIKDAEEGYLLGVGVVGLRSVFEHANTVMEFSSRLSIFDETRGTVKGKISLRIE